MDLTTSLSKLLQRLVLAPDQGGLPVVLYANGTVVGSVGTGEDTLMTYAMPGDVLNANGMAVRVVAWGLTLNNGNTKAIKLYFGGTAIASFSSTYNNQPWRIEAEVMRTSGTAQIANSVRLISGGLAVLNAAPAETLSGAVTIKCTGQSTEGTNDDITQLGMIVEWLPAGATS